MGGQKADSAQHLPQREVGGSMAALGGGGKPGEGLAEAQFTLMMPQLH